MHSFINATSLTHGLTCTNGPVITLLYIGLLAKKGMFAKTFPDK